MRIARARRRRGRGGLGARADRSACASRARCRWRTSRRRSSRATRRPLTGIPILAAVLYVMYLFVGVFGAQTLVGLFEDGIFGRGINPAATWLVDRAIPFAFASATSSSASTGSSRWV